jgi:TolB-like protein
MNQAGFRRAIIALLAIIFLISGCSGTREKVKSDVSLKEKRFRIAVYPLENLSGNPVPLSSIRQMFINELGQLNLDVVGEESFRRFMAKHRVRYTGGLDRTTAKALKDELGADGVFIVSIELFFEEFPPKIALISRLVATGDKATISWIDGVGLAGDDSPGILDLGMIEDPKVLSEKAVRLLVKSLASFLSEGKERTDIGKVARRYQPKILFRSPLLESDRKYTIAIIPFFNRSERRNAGEIMVLHFVKQLKRFENFDVIEPGIIRQEFLSLRIIMEDGISLPQAESVFAALDADLVLSGKVMDYRDYKSFWGKAKVDFSSQLIDRRSQMVVWSSMSYNDGEEGVYFFDWGKVNTAHGLTKRMIQSMGERIIREEPEDLPLEEPILPAFPLY